MPPVCWTRTVRRASGRALSGISDWRSKDMVFTMSYWKPSIPIWRDTEMPDFCWSRALAHPLRLRERLCVFYPPLGRGTLLDYGLKNSGDEEEQQHGGQ